tara:strand:- start:3284 stop:5407 length:2124 start_codon:yes stop_codon:yes gene_type:complete
MAKKIKVYLGSMSHNYACNGPFTHPLNLGYLSSYAMKYFSKPDELDIRLFVYPNDILDEINSDPPDILGLASYTWNDNLNLQILQHVKKVSPNTVTIMGGPNFNNYNLEEYFLKRPYLDYYIVNQGETGFLNLINSYSEGKLNRNSKDEISMDNVAFYNTFNKKVCIGDISKRYRELDVIPSPILDGTLDKFFKDKNLIPIIETMRGCPFTCTYCAWGDDWLRASNRFSLERVISEIEYIAKKFESSKNKFNGYLYLADSNFGMHRRDAEIASKIRECHDKYNWPSSIWATWAKNSNEKVIEIASILKPLLQAGVTIAYESLDDKTLENVRRANISLEKFNKVREYIKSKGLKTHTDVILGLPGETKDTYLNGLRKVTDQKFDQVVTFNCRLLGGTEMNTPTYIEKHGIKTKYRMLTQGYGIYRGIKSVENEEVILSTSTMSQDEIILMRPVNWFLYLFWNNGYYVEFMKYMQQLGINPIDFILDLMDNLKNSKDKMGDLFGEFMRESEEEWYNSPEELYKDNSQIIDGKLKAENFAKLNAKYTSKVVFGYKEEMSKKLLEVAQKSINKNFDKDMFENKKDEIRDVINFCSEKSINISEIREKKLNNKHKYFIYDYPKWLKKDNGEADIQKYNGGININFYLSKAKLNRISEAMEIHNYEDIYEVHMKLIEVLHTDDLFYDTKTDGSDSTTISTAKDKGITNWSLES